MFLEIKNLHAKVGKNEILKGIDLKVGLGEVHAIMGPNGSGKSTLAQVLAGRDVYAVTEGEVRYDAHDLLALSPEDRARYGLQGYGVGAGSKGCVTFSPVKIVDYETFKAHQDVPLSTLAWLFNMNRGIFMTPGREEEWTLSVTHDDASVDAYVQVFEAMADDLMG